MIVREIQTAREREQFIRFPWKIYRNDANWVPPLILERRKFLNPKDNPFFEHAAVKLFMACDDSDAELGRIAAIINHNHLRTHSDKTGFFGMFESIDDRNVARALFDAAAAFLRSHGMTTMRGPENLSVNDDLGLLIEGFDTPPAIMMPHNPPYYEALIEAYGFGKAMDLLAYYGLFTGGHIPEEADRGADICQRRLKCTVRSLRTSEFEAELSKIHAVYTSAWEDNWGALAMTDHEFEHLAKMLKDVLDPDLCLIGEIDGEIAGFSLALPDFNQVLIRLNGKLLPFGILKFLYYKRRIDSLRLLAMGVVKKFRHRGLDSLFYCETYRRALSKGILGGEMSWILENNILMNRILERLGFRVYKKYRLYDYCL
jgi:GNAT superfamily N-acetyltransferase